MSLSSSDMSMFSFLQDKITATCSWIQQQRCLRYMNASKAVVRKHNDLRISDFQYANDLHIVEKNSEGVCVCVCLFVNVQIHVKQKDGGMEDH